MISWEGKRLSCWNFGHWHSIKLGTFLWKNHAENVHQTLVPDPFFILVNNPMEPLHARNSLKSLLKSKLYFFFPTQSLLMDEIIKNKRGLELVNSPSSGYKTSSKNFFISYTLSDHVWWCNMKRFLSYYKNYTFKFMQAYAWHH